MRTLKIQIKPLLSLAMICLACLIFTSGHSDEGSSLNKEKLDYTAFLSPLLQEIDNLEELIIIERKFVSPGVNEKEAPRDIIHVASGLFQEFLIIDSPELTILGLPGPDGERMMMIHPGEIVTRMTQSCVGKNAEVSEICLEHFHEKSFRICPGANFSDTTGTPPFTMVRNELPQGLVQYVCELPLRSNKRDLIRIYRLF